MLIWLWIDISTFRSMELKFFNHRDLCFIATAPIRIRFLWFKSECLLAFSTLLFRIVSFNFTKFSFYRTLSKTRISLSKAWVQRLIFFSKAVYWSIDSVKISLGRNDNTNYLHLAIYTQFWLKQLFMNIPEKQLNHKLELRRYLKQIISKK